ncbi:MAG: hypothetical protein WAL97_01740 [Halobacteriota archaeon]
MNPIALRARNDGRQFKSLFLKMKKKDTLFGCLPHEVRAQESLFFSSAEDLAPKEKKASEKLQQQKWLNC